MHIDVTPNPAVAVKRSNIHIRIKCSSSVHNEHESWLRTGISAAALEPRACLCAEDSMGCTACMLSSALFQTCVAWHRETVYKRCCGLPRARKRFIIITASEYYTAEARRVLQLRNAYFHSLLVDVHESDRELLIEIE
mmetsp:Transcript_14296/g.23510  ORF Transcript_14296/g.23510 Transcript_14296/m.23510 type:complete len:138 (-) Transcript_14296:670-1083(-)